MSEQTTMNKVIQGHIVAHLATIDSSGEACMRILGYTEEIVSSKSYSTSRDYTKEICYGQDFTTYI
jgi:hypothetical protein